MQDRHSAQSLYQQDLAAAPQIETSCGWANLQSLQTEV